MRGSLSLTVLIVACGGGAAGPVGPANRGAAGGGGGGGGVAGGSLDDVRAGLARGEETGPAGGVVTGPG